MTTPHPAPTPPARRSFVTRPVVLAAVGVLLAVTGGIVGYVLAAEDRADPVMGHDGWYGAGAAQSEQEFLTEMVAHHEEAIDAARELDRSDRTQMRALGRSIVQSQTSQVEQMKAWSRTWYGASPESGYTPMMRDLSALAGDRLDEVFLVDMVRHHMAAVMMARQLLSGGDLEHAELGRLARTIIEDQTSELVQMQRWLREWFDEGMMGSSPMMDPARP